MKVIKKYGKKAVSLILASLMATGMLPMSAITASAADNLTVTIDTGAEVTLKDADGDDYYDIGTADELYAFAAAVNGGNTTINGELTDYIIINAGYTFNSDGTVTKDGEAVTEGFREWTPIGSSESIYNGTFDGQNHTISGLYFNENINYVGLFGYVKEGTIKNVGIINNYINAGNYVGSVIGYNNTGTVTNCYNSGTVISSNCDSSYVGGVIGYSILGTVTNCYNTGTVSSNCDVSYVGGVIGYSYFGKATNCYNTGTVSSSNCDYSYIGGVVGYNYYRSVTNCYNTGTVSSSDCNRLYVGGVVGCNYDGEVTNCYNTGTVSSSNCNRSYVGGVVGYTNGGEVTNCYNTGNISGVTVDGTAECGGIVGNNYYGKINNCYSSTASIACINKGTITNSYYLADEETEDGGKTAEQFASGEVAYLLQGKQTEQIWGQDIDNDNDIQLYPTFTGAKVYQVINCNNEYCYSNTNENIDHNWIDANCTTPKTCSVCKLTDGEALGHEYDNNFCSICDAYLPATDENGDGVYEIANSGQLYWFAEFVNAGNTSANAVLTDDIVINAGYTFNSDGTVTKDGEAVTEGFREWTPIGSSEFNYNGTFDGQNHTISGLYFNKNINYVGLFGYVKEGTIKNVGIINNYINAGDYVGGIIGYSIKDTVTNCYNSGTVSSNCDSSYVGGVIGFSGFDTVTNCYNTGTVISSNCGYSYVGGVIGYSSFGKATNCYNSGTVISSNCDESHVGGVVGYHYDCVVTNCYNLGTVSSNCDYSYVGGVVGYHYDSVVTNCYNTGYISGVTVDGTAECGSIVGYSIYYSEINNCYYLADEETEDGGKTAEQFASGEVAYLLQGEQTEQIWGQDIDNDSDIQLYPTFTGAKVYQVINCNNEYCYSNTNENIDHNWIDANCTTPKTCSVCKLTDGEALGHEYDNYFCSICNTYLPATDENGDGVYEIANFGQLYWFADFVNAGNTSANAVLTDDIVINAGYTFNSDGTVTKDGEAVTEGFREWTPIGSSESIYNGTFDGQNHTISGLYFNKNINYVGLFGYVNEGTIKNVGIINNYINAGYYVGGIIGYSIEGSVTNCYNSGTVIGSNCDSSDVGGVIGFSGFVTVTNCYNTGTVISSNCDKSYVGGVIGYSTRASTVTNCYNSGTVSSSNCDKSYVGGVIGYSRISVTNCYNTGTVISSNCDDSYVGGVVGYSGISVSNCYNTGTVIISSNCDYSYIGGVVGYSSSKVTNCYNSGTVSSDCDLSYVGGVVGYNRNTVTNCYNTGNISGVTVDGTAECGGIVGVNNGTITNSYYLADEETEDGGKTAEQFASGEVAYLLGEAFGQKIGTDACPVIGGDKVYCGYKDCSLTENIYSNSPLNELPEHTHEFADIDLDNRVTILDATALAKALAGITTLTDCQYSVADVNNDGMININDVTYIQMMLADLV